MATAHQSLFIRLLFTGAAVAGGIGVAMLVRLLILNDHPYPELSTARVGLVLIAIGVVGWGVAFLLARRARRVPPAA